MLKRSYGRDTHPRLDCQSKLRRHKEAVWRIPAVAKYAKQAGYEWGGKHSSCP